MKRTKKFCAWVLAAAMITTTAFSAASYSGESEMGTEYVQAEELSAETEELSVETEASSEEGAAETNGLTADAAGTEADTDEESLSEGAASSNAETEGLTGDENGTEISTEAQPETNGESDSEAATEETGAETESETTAPITEPETEPTSESESETGSEEETEDESELAEVDELEADTEEENILEDGWETYFVIDKYCSTTGLTEEVETAIGQKADSYKISYGELLEGVTLDSDGTLHGTVGSDEGRGHCDFGVLVTYEKGGCEKSVVVDCTIWLTENLLEMEEGSWSYFFTIDQYCTVNLADEVEACIGQKADSYQISYGELPEGVALSSDGILHGTATSNGDVTYFFGVLVNYKAESGDAKSVVVNCGISLKSYEDYESDYEIATEGEDLYITSVNGQAIMANQYFSTNIIAETMEKMIGKKADSYQVTYYDDEPEGVTLSSDGTLYGTAACGIYYSEVTASYIDDNGEEDEKEIECTLVVKNSEDEDVYLTSGLVNVPYSTGTLTPGEGWYLSGSTFTRNDADWLKFASDPNEELSLYGTPTEAGEYVISAPFVKYVDDSVLDLECAGVKTVNYHITIEEGNSGTDEDYMQTVNPGDSITIIIPEDSNDNGNVTVEVFMKGISEEMLKSSGTTVGLSVNGIELPLEICTIQMYAAEYGGETGCKIAITIDKDALEKYCNEGNNTIVVNVENREEGLKKYYPVNYVLKVSEPETEQQTETTKQTETETGSTEKETTKKKTTTSTEAETGTSSSQRETTTETSAQSTSTSKFTVTCGFHLSAVNGNKTTGYMIQLDSSDHIHSVDESGNTSFSSVSDGTHTVYVLTPDGTVVGSTEFTLVEGKEILMNGQKISVIPGSEVWLSLDVDGSTVTIVGASSTAVPDTGDQENLYLWLTLLALSAAAAGLAGKKSAAGRRS